MAPNSRGLPKSLRFGCNRRVNQPLRSFGYVSRSLLPDDIAEHELARLVATSRGTNAAWEITGALVQAGSFFAQILEGPADSLAALRERLERDPRHFELTTFEDREIDQRRFSGWSLAYAGRANVITDYLRRLHNRNALPNDGQRLVTMMLQFVSA